MKRCYACLKHDKIDTTYSVMNLTPETTTDAFVIDNVMMMRTATAGII